MQKRGPLASTDRGLRDASAMLTKDLLSHQKREELPQVGGESANDLAPTDF
jgi:hypothetical protein